MKTNNWPIGVCTWSLGADIQAVAPAIQTLGLKHVHLAVGPACRAGGEAYLQAVGECGWTITSTMIAFPQEDYSSLESIRATGGIMPDANWPANRGLARQAVELTARLGVKYLSFHAGFLDHARAEQARKFSDRMRELADAAAQDGVVLLMETGQETPEDLRRFLARADHPALAVNYDPANVILYDKGDPIEAVRTLRPWIRHVHVKDAIRTRSPGAWGAEVPWGDGEVGAAAFLDVLREIGYEGALAVEREGGDDRLGDVKLAVERLAQHGA